MFDWDRGNIKHIFQHDISPQEAEEAFYDPDRSIHHAHSGNRKIIGMTEDGRLLAIILQSVRRRLDLSQDGMQRKQNENHTIEKGGSKDG
ncbi:hypothetical protein J9317_02285 [Metabacillus sp. KIGAM252]|uniref:DUF4258 domain-containing protein n=1 Tax=Metabacillus flavus TaxID=2823519 RepID=A0ABS5LA50_9BACI|nr:hypothetical protein [Metabacillus flavus]MBS2967599.1 hypothetical protein [Metabacillus flavus]